jgi:hypothetical protein
MLPRKEMKQASEVVIAVALADAFSITEQEHYAKG